MRKAKDTPKKEAAWQKSAPYLFLHVASGTYYLRVRLGKQDAHRESLKTDNFQVAKARIGPRLKELREARPPKEGWAATTLWDALQRIEVQFHANPSLKVRSKGAYADVIKSMKPGARCGVPTTTLPKLTAAECEEWWRKTAASYAPARANFQLLFFRQALTAARKDGAVTRDIDANLRPLKIPRTRLKLITREQFAALVDEVAKISRDAAEWVEFVAYTGCRPEEANSVTWEHCDRKAMVLTVTGNATGTKNRETRRVPIMPALAELLARIEARTGNAGRVLSLRDPGKSLRQACLAIGIPSMRRYDFRHLFATRCNEAGVDIPSIAKWLGHKDGGALAMKTYVHVHSAHEQTAAAKVKF